MTTCLEKSCSFGFSASAFRKLLSVYVFSYFPFGFEDRMWDLIVSVPDHCLSYLLFTESHDNCLQTIIIADNSSSQVRAYKS